MSTGSTTSIYSTYILFLTKLQKSQISKRDLLKLKNDITQFFIDMKRVLHCRKHKSRIEDFEAES